MLQLERYEEYLDDYILCEYRAKSTFPLDKAARAIATEQSTGTWTQDIKGKRGDLTAKVLAHEPNIILAFPLEDADLHMGGIAQLLSLVAGNLFGLEELTSVRFQDMYVPPAAIKEFKGPKFGVEGLHECLGQPIERPLVGTIVKPKIGLDPKATAEYVYQGGMGGLTNSKDDETLVDQGFCPIMDRCVEVSEALDRVEAETGHKMMHAFNITGRPEKMLELGEQLIEQGARQLMVDVLVAGFGSLRMLAEDPSIKVPIHVHRAMHAAMTRDPKHGISMRIFSLLTRLAGGDALHVDTFGVGKMHGSAEEDKESQLALESKMGHLKRPLTVCSGGMHPGLVVPLLKITGSRVQLQAGGGVAGHPEGITAGSKAMNQAIDAYLAGVTAGEYAKEHMELALALEKWGEVSGGDY